MPFFKYQYGGYASDIEPGGDALVRFGVEFGQPDMGLKAHCSLFKHRPHHFAGPAPRSPKINDHRNRIFPEKAVKGGVVQCHWMAVKQQLAAISAFRSLAKPFRGHTIRPAASSTQDVGEFTHNLFLPSGLILKEAALPDFKFHAGFHACSVYD